MLTTHLVGRFMTTPESHPHVVHHSLWQLATLLLVVVALRGLSHV